VHLYSRYLSDEHLAAINKELIAADFVVKPNQLKFPQSITQSSLIYSPIIADRNTVNNVINTVSEMGWDIPHISMLFADNHWYKENSIALMLVPLGINPTNQTNQTNQQDWANEYSSQNCDLTLTIRLKKNGQYQIFRSTNQLINEDFSEGTWNITVYPYMELRSKKSTWGLYFELNQYLAKDQLGEIHISELSPMSNYRIFADCSFANGVRL
jgi:hypothetical protein